MKQPAQELPSRSDLRVADITSSAIDFDILTNGIEVARFFQKNPDAPGGIVSKGGKFFGAFSHDDFLRAISRQFGSEVFYHRPIAALLEFLHHKAMLLLPSDCLIHEAVDRCLGRNNSEIFGPFLIENRETGMIRMVDFRTLILASSDVLAFRNQQLANEMRERELLEQKLLRAQRMETVGMLAGGIAHNLNNTLAPIMMAASMMERNLPREMHIEFVRTIQNSVQRAAEIIEQLLAFSRGLESKKLTLSPAKLIREVEKFVWMTFPKSITFFAHVGDDLCNIVGDQTQLHQVLLNLCVNARDAMPSGGTLTISAENCDIDQTFEDTPPDILSGRYLKVSVTDTGCGIPPEVIDKIFDPFFTTKEVGKGTGLGLSTAVGIVRCHNGFMKVASQAGTGTTFTIYLPATETAVVDTTVRSALDIPMGQGELILFVDDEAQIRRTAEGILKQNGYRVLTACDGDEALAVFNNWHSEVSLVLTDISMPTLDGVDLARTLKIAKPNLKIVVSSGRIDQNHESSLRNVGVTGRLWKPYRTDQLLRTVHFNLHGRSGAFDQRPIKSDADDKRRGEYAMADIE